MNGQMLHYALDFYPRRFALLPPLKAVGFLPRKDYRVKMNFDSCNFSFILDGRGEYILDGKAYPVQAPCILLQWPGAAPDYGPEGSWREMYLIYPGDTFSYWKSSGLFHPGTPVRRLENAGMIMPLISRFQELLKHPELSIDEIDLFAGEILVKSGRARRGEEMADPRIKTILQYLESSIGTDIDCRELAKELNMSISSLRRYWREHYGAQTFSQFRNNLMLQKSCRLLVETKLSVKEIAQQLGFADPFYFSRKFHLLMGMPPFEYRKKYTP